MPQSAAPSQPDPRAASEVGHGLRAIPGGYDLTSWPIHVALQPEEQLAGWWMRLAHRYGMTASTLLRTVSPHVKTYGRRSVGERLSRPRHTLTRLTGVTDTDRQASWQAEQRLFDDRLSLATTYGISTRMPPRIGSRFCPLCLAQDGTWRTSWTDPAVLACVAHGTLLNETCPQCGAQPFRTLTWATTVHPPHECHAPVTNHHEKHRHYPTCGTDLRTAPTASAPPQLVDATRTLLPTGAEPAALISAGRRVTPAELREALLLLTVTLMRRPAHGNPPLDRRVETALSAAMEVLDHQDRSTAAHHAASLIALHPGSSPG